MYPPPELRTSNAELLGTTAGIIITFIVATIGLAVMLGMVYWAAAHPGYKRPAQPPRAQQGITDSAASENEGTSVQRSPQNQPGRTPDNLARLGEAQAADGAAQLAEPQRGRTLTLGPRHENPSPPDRR